MTVNSTSLSENMALRCQQDCMKIVNTRIFNENFHDDRIVYNDDIAASQTPKNSSVLLSPTVFFVTATTAITNVSSVILLKSDGLLMSLPYLNFHLEYFM